MVVVAVASMAGCDRGSPAYNHIKDLHYTQWESYAVTLPIDKRLDLHKEIMERSGHNPPMTIEFSFSAEPSETYNLIVKRLRNGDRSRYYQGVIYDINRSSFKICAQPDRRIVQEYLLGITGYPGHEKDRPDFYTC